MHYMVSDKRICIAVGDLFIFVRRTLKPEFKNFGVSVCHANPTLGTILYHAHTLYSDMGWNPTLNT